MSSSAVKNATNITELAAAVGLKDPVLGLILAEIGVDLTFPLDTLGESTVQEVEAILGAVKIPAADGTSTPASLNLGHKVAVRSFFKETRERACPAAAIPQQLTATSSVQPQPGAVVGAVQPIRHNLVIDQTHDGLSNPISMSETVQCYTRYQSI